MTTCEIIKPSLLEGMSVLIYSHSSEVMEPNLSQQLIKSDIKLCQTSQLRECTIEWEVCSAYTLVQRGPHHSLEAGYNDIIVDFGGHQLLGPVYITPSCSTEAGIVPFANLICWS